MKENISTHKEDNRESQNDNYKSTKLYSREKSISNFSTTQYTKFSSSEKNNNFTIKQSSIGSYILPHKRLTEPLWKNHKTIKLTISEFEKRKNQLKDINKCILTNNTEKFKDRKEFLKYLSEKKDLDKLSYSQLKSYLESYIKEILKLDDERMNELINK